MLKMDTLGRVVSAKFVDTQQGYVLAYVEQADQSWKPSLYTTSDGGQHWNSTHQNLPNLAPGYANVVPDFTSSTVGWVLSVDQQNQTSLYTTSDGGKTWTQVHAHFPSFITPPSAY